MSDEYFDGERFAQDVYGEPEVRKEDGKKTRRIRGGDGLVEGPESSTELDDWEGDSSVKIDQVRYGSIRSDKRRDAIKAFIDNWKDKNTLNSRFVVRMNAGEDGKLWIKTIRNGELHSFPVWMLSRVLGIGMKRQPETEVGVSKGGFVDMNRDAVREGWQKLMRRLVIEKAKRPNLGVEMTGPWENKKKVNKSKERKEFKEKKHGVLVDLERAGKSGSKERRRVAKVIGLMEMESGEPNFGVGKDDDGTLKVDVRNGERVERVEVDSLMKTMPELARKSEDGNLYWSAGERSVDVTSNPEEWERFLEEIRIKGRVKKKV